MVVVTNQGVLGGHFDVVGVEGKLVLGGKEEESVEVEERSRDDGR